jgi:hypothetical protein
MESETDPGPSLGRPSSAIGQADVTGAADRLLAAGERPTVKKVRAKIGRGSPNTINPLLDNWWKTLAARFEAGPPALYRLPEAVAHICEALWQQTLEAAQERAGIELRKRDSRLSEKEQHIEVRSAVLSLREGELNARIRALSQEAALWRRLYAKEQAVAQLLKERLERLEAQLRKKRSVRLSVRAPVRKTGGARRRPRTTTAKPRRRAGKTKKR